MKMACLKAVHRNSYKGYLILLYLLFGFIELVGKGECTIEDSCVVTPKEKG